MFDSTRALDQLIKRFLKVGAVSTHLEDSSTLWKRVSLVKVAVMK